MLTATSPTVWYRDDNGERHNEGAPAELVYSDDGTLLDVAWYWHGSLHREGGPASESFHDDGTVARQSWHLHGVMHRSDGAAVERWDVNGRLLEREWWHHGERVSEIAGRAHEWGVHCDNLDAIAMLEQHDVSELGQHHPIVLLALSLYPNP